MEIEIRTGEQFRTSRWGGGSTTEFYIWPEDGDYGRRNFQVRVSSAAVEQEESAFTKLPGVERSLMLLDGNICLVFQGHGERVLNKYEAVVFQGGWDTVSYGKATDFNLMCRDGAKGSLHYLEVPAYSTQSLQPVYPSAEGGSRKLLLYTIEGQGDLNGTSLPGHSLAVINTCPEEAFQIQNTGGIPLRLAVCCIVI